MNRESLWIKKFDGIKNGLNLIIEIKPSKYTLNIVYVQNQKNTQ